MKRLQKSGVQVKILMHKNVWFQELGIWRNSVQLWLVTSIQYPVLTVDLQWLKVEEEMWLLWPYPSQTPYFTSEMEKKKKSELSRKTYQVINLEQ